MPPTILGVDPGARETGLALIDNDRLLGHAVLKAAGKLDPKNPVDLEYLELVVEGVRLLVDRYVEFTPSPSGGTYRLDAIALEKIGAPNPHLGMTNAAGAIAVGGVIGAIATMELPQDVTRLLIDTAGHGSNLLATYPKELIGEREGPKGTGILRHARSAYDVALAARWYLRTGAPTR